jgi:hypothetical protein
MLARHDAGAMAERGQNHGNSKFGFNLRVRGLV